MLSSELLEDCRAVALAHRLERLRLGPKPHWRHYEMELAMVAYAERHPEFDLNRHADRLEVSRRVTLLLHHACRMSGPWIYGLPAAEPDGDQQLVMPDW